MSNGQKVNEMSFGQEFPFPLHGPGPPLHATTETLTSSRDTEIQRLKKELQLCQGKIKGYETLGQLFQESKQECTRYKQKNEELARRLDSLTRRLSPSELLNEPLEAACLNVQSSTIIYPNDSHGLTGNAESSFERDAVGICVDTRQCDEQRTCLNLKEVGATSPPMSNQGRSAVASTASSPSFVQINSSDAGSPVSPLSSTQKQLSQSNVMSSACSMSRAASEDLSSEVNRLAEHLKTLGHSSGPSGQDLASDLITAGVNVIKLQKQTRMQQVLMDQMTSQINELRADIASKLQTILILQKDCDTLRNTIKRMETAREQDAMIRYAKEQDDVLGEPNSAEWVEVETRQSSAAAGKEAGGANASETETVLTVMPVVEVELRRRLEKLNATISELVSVNRSWDEHCRQLESTHAQQTASLQSKLDDAVRRLEEYEEADQKRQLDFDNILLNAKKQREAEEMAKEEALNQLHLERQQRVDLEQKCVDFSRKTAELESRLIQQCFMQAELAESNRHVLVSSQHATETSSAREHELQTRLHVLHEQVRIFKEDFDQERRDREQMRSKMESNQKKLKEQSDLNYSIRQQLAQTTAELTAVKTERDHWRQRYQKLSDDLHALQRQARPTELRVSTAPTRRDVTHTPTTQRPVVYNYVVSSPAWDCSVCTFKNDGRRTSCEMCGQMKHRNIQQVGNATMVDGRSVAGLLSSQPAMPIASLVTRSLETDTPGNKHQ